MKAENDPYAANLTLLAAVEKLPILGRIRGVGAAGGWELRLAFQSPLEGGGRRIVLVTNGANTTDRNLKLADHGVGYPFIVVEIHLGADDRGEGKNNRGSRLMIGTDDHFVLENYDRRPVDFNEIHKK